MTDREWDRFRRSTDAHKLWRTQEIKGVENRYVYRWSWSPSWLAELWSCPWCVSGWIAGAVTAGTDIMIGLPVPVLQGVAVWALGAVAASREWL